MAGYVFQMNTVKQKRNVIFRVNTLRGGGAERVLVTLVKYINYNDFNVTVLANKKGYLLEGELSEKCTFKYLFLRSGIIKSKIYLPFYALFKELAFALVTRYPQILYMLGTIGKFDVEVASCEDMIPHIAKSINGSSLKIAWIHSDVQNNKSLDSALREKICRSLTNFDQVLIVSEQAAASLLDFCLKIGMDPGPIKRKIKIIHNPIDEKRIRSLAEGERSLGKDTPVFFAMGDLSENKGFDRLIKAHKMVLDLGFPHDIKIAGSGLDKEALQELINQLAVGETVELLGHLENPYAILKSSDAFVLSSRSEGFSLVLAEAMILGKPIVSTNITGANEILGDGRFGKLIDNSIDGIKEGLLFFLEDSMQFDLYEAKAKAGADQFALQERISDLEEVLTGREKA